LQPRIKAGLGGLNVFFYPHKQEDLIGSNGLESMRAPFLGARVSVILFRDRYGKMPWTGVELAAIQDSCLKTGFRSLVFVQLDKREQIPGWLPSTHIRCVLGDFTVDQLVGAIKNRVQENGGTIRRPDARSEAFRIQQEAEYLTDRQDMLRGAQWVEGTVKPTVNWTFDHVIELVKETAAETGMLIEAGRATGHVIITDGRISMVAGWKQEIFGNVEQDAYFYIREFSGPISVPGQLLAYPHPPKLLREHKLTADLTLAREPCWKRSGSKEQIAANGLPDHVMMTLLDLLSPDKPRQGRDAVPLSNWAHSNSTSLPPCHLAPHGRWGQRKAS
jgi:hypothetical protein